MQTILLRVAFSRHRFRMVRDRGALTEPSCPDFLIFERIATCWVTPDRNRCRGPVKREIIESETLFSTPCNFLLDAIGGILPKNRQDQYDGAKTKIRLSSTFWGGRDGR